MKLRGMFIVAALIVAGCNAERPDLATHADLLIRNGVIYDGTGAAPAHTAVAVRGDRVVAVGELQGWTAEQEVDAKGLAVAPGFINMLSWGTESLLVDGRAVSDLKQGVTTELMGEGMSMGPVNDEMRKVMLASQADLKYDITWKTLGGYLETLVSKGVSVNVGSMIGAETARTHVLGNVDREPTAKELEQMKELVREAMREGALGVGSSLIYAPGFYAKTPELKAIVAAAGEFGGGYISHMRSEGNRFLEALDELIEIARATGVHAEVYHLKAAGEKNWPKMKQAIARIEKARKEGLPISADMYAYVAGATGLDAAMPPWVQEGGLDEWIKRLKDPIIRARVIKEMRTPTDKWENLLLSAGSPERVLFIGFKSEKLKPLTGKTLAQVSKMRGTSPEDTVIDLVIEDHYRVGTAYFLMSEENVKLGLSQPWVSLGSDEGAYEPAGVFLKSNPHPRAYGNFARFLGKYVREERVTTLADAIRRMTQLPAQTWKLKDRGCLAAGCYADIVIFDPDKIIDHATFDKPHQYATGVRDVFVNGVQALKDGEPTKARPGQVIRGPGWVGWRVSTTR
jgi:N-acyl-D-amino-acid deacylase